MSYKAYRYEGNYGFDKEDFFWRFKTADDACAYIIDKTCDTNASSIIYEFSDNETPDEKKDALFFVWECLDGTIKWEYTEVADFENGAETIVPNRAVIFGIEYDSMEDELIVE